MIDECVYYIKLQPYYSYIPFETFVIRFLNSALFRTVFDKIELPSCVPSMSALVKKETLSIEIHNLFMKYVQLAHFDAKSNQKRLNPREIDEIISKYILFHLQQFFRDGPPPLAHNTNSAAKHRMRRVAKTMKKKGSSSIQQHHPDNIFHVNKTTAIKNMHNKTIHKR